MKYQLNFPLLVDKDRELASKYGVTKRSTFVIGPDGTIEQALYGVKVTGHVDALKESLIR